MSIASLNPTHFLSRYKRIQQIWNTHINADSIVVPVGRSDDDVLYQRCIAVQMWMLGFEFPDTVMVILPKKIVFMTTGQRKVEVLNTLRNIENPPDIEILVRKKNDQAENEKVTKQFLDIVKNAGNKVGIIAKNETTGAFIEEWNTTFQEATSDMESVDITTGIGYAMSVKDSSEVKNMTIAAKASAMMMENYFLNTMTAIVDEDIPTTHVQLSEKVDQGLFDEKIRKSSKVPKEADASFLDWCYPPIIQSRKFELKPSAQSDGEMLRSSTIVASLGVRYKSYCSNVGRTYLIDPHKEVESNLKVLMGLQKHVIENMKDGVALNALYGIAVQYLQDNKPDLVGHLTKNLGFLTGIEFREGTHLISPKHTAVMQNGQVYNLSMGFHNLTDPKQNTEYALLLADTILVQSVQAINLTEGAEKALDSVSFFLDDQNDKKNQANEQKQERKAKEAKRVILDAKLRQERQEGDLTAAQKRAEHQKTLFDKVMAEGIKRYGNTGGTEETEKKQIFRKFESYKSMNSLPSQVADLKIYVDRRQETVILPIYGQPVPFHIMTLKNVSKGTEGEFTTLRLNFNTPGQIAKKEEIVPFDDATKTFVRALTFRSLDTFRINDTYKTINDLLKGLRARENERKERADLKQQDSLILARGRSPALGDVQIRPPLDSKKFGGDLEIHENGLRYQPSRNPELKVDILFDNIEHMFFQPCTHEMYVIIHFHLKDAIMVGKRKTVDLQVCREAVDGGAGDETSNRKHRRAQYGDEDELQAEQTERRKKKALDKEFSEFAKAIQEAAPGLEIDTPYRNLGFNGVPFRNNVLLQPTTDCLVHLSEAPFLVLSIADIELAHMQRVSFGLKSFDIVFVFKDYSKPAFPINSIPTTQIEEVRNWLDSADIAFTEGPVSLNWTQIMKTVLDDPAAFFEEGGWTFLNPETDDEEEEDEDEDSVFEASSGSDDSDEAYSSDDSDSDEFEEDSESEEGQDWEELEKSAIREDRGEAPSKSKGKKTRDVSSEPDRKPTKKSRK